MVRHTPAQGLRGDERAVRDRAAPFWLGGGEDVPRVLGTPLGPRDSRELFDEAGPDGGLDAVRADEDVARRRRAVVELEVYPWLPRPGLRVRDEAFVRVLAAGGAEVSEEGAVEIRAVKGEEASFVGMSAFGSSASARDGEGGGDCVTWSRERVEVDTGGLVSLAHRERDSCVWTASSQRYDEKGKSVMSRTEPRTGEFGGREHGDLGQVVTKAEST